MMKTIYRPVVCLLLALGLVSGRAWGQDDDDPWEEPDDESAGTVAVVIGVKGGVVSTTPRGAFPSLIIGSSIEGTGEIPSSHAETGIGSRYSLAFLVPFTETVGLSAEIGALRYLTGYQGDTSRLETRFEAQTLQLAFGMQANVYFDPRSFVRGGLRCIYLDGGLDIGLATLGNLVESSARLDSVTGEVPLVGSFATTEPFRNVVAFRGAVGMRFAFTPHVEAQAEASYAVALNSVFSSTVVVDNDFAVDHLALQVGIGYRF